MQDYILASGSSDNKITIWNTKTGELVKTINEHPELVDSLAVREDGSLISGSWDSSIRIWNSTYWSKKIKQ